jgi:hypothetical protein
MASRAVPLHRSRSAPHIDPRIGGEDTKTEAFRERLLLYLSLSLLFVLVVTPLILMTQPDAVEARDEMRYHYPTILKFWEEFPKLDLQNYYSATTPLYHLLMMGLAFVIGPDLIALRFMNATIGLLCLLFIYTFFLARGTKVNAFVFTLALLFSPYFVGPSALLYTDNLALLFIVMSIWAMERVVAHKASWLLVNLFVLLTVLTRQVHIWLSGVALLFSSYELRDAFNRKLQLPVILTQTWLALIPIGILAIFMLLWGGLTPTPFVGKQESETFPNWDALTYIVALVGLYGGCLIVWYWRLWQPRQNKWHFVSASALLLVGGLYLLLTPYMIEADATKPSGALWQLAYHMPTLFSTSIVFWVLFPLGLVLLYITMQALIARHEYVIAVSLPLWLLANLATNRVYQRYYEPFLLFIIGYSLVVLKQRASWQTWAGPVLLVGGLALMTFVRFALPILP